MFARICVTGTTSTFTDFGASFTTDADVSVCLTLAQATLRPPNEAHIEGNPDFIFKMKNPGIISGRAAEVRSPPLGIRGAVSNAGAPLGEGFPAGGGTASGLWNGLKFRGYEGNICGASCRASSDPLREVLRSTDFN